MADPKDTQTELPEPAEAQYGEIVTTSASKAVALLAASTLLSHANVSKDDVIALARQFEEYLDADDDAEGEAVA